MNIWDIILVTVIAAAFVGAIISTVKKKKNGNGCCGDCSKCGKNNG